MLLIHTGLNQQLFPARFIYSSFGNKSSYTNPDVFPLCLASRASRFGQEALVFLRPKEKALILSPPPTRLPYAFCVATSQMYKFLDRHLGIPLWTHSAGKQMWFSWVWCFKKVWMFRELIVKWFNEAMLKLTFKNKREAFSALMATVGDLFRSEGSPNNVHKQKSI